MGTVTVTTTAQEDARLAPAFGAYLQLPGNASANQIKAAFKNFALTVVLNYEQGLELKKGADNAQAVVPINPVVT